MKFIGHTMGTPGRTPEASAAVFAAIGLNGMEIVCQAESAFHSGIGAAAARRLAGRAAAIGVPVLALTPYAWDINSPDPATAAAQLDELRRVVDLAAVMGARYVRAYGGRADERDPEAAFRRTVEALRAAGSHAAARDVVLLVENHPGTMTRTGAATRRLVDAVGLSALRILYDPANVLCDTAEDWRVTLDLQLDAIAYVHVKDFDEDAGRRRARIVGEGVVPWTEILGKLRQHGYDGCLSFEYEKKWYPDDLPEAEIGMRRSLAFVRRCLEAWPAGKNHGS